MKVVSEEYYLCDICHKRTDRHFKVKVPVPYTKLKKWKRFDMCDDCYIEFYKKCNQATK